MEQELVQSSRKNRKTVNSLALLTTTNIINARRTQLVMAERVLLTDSTSLLLT